jgi:hypothetical protein
MARAIIEGRHPVGRLRRHLDRRTFVTISLLLFLAAACALVGLWAYTGFSLGMPTKNADRATVISADVALVSFALVALGVVVALVAYLASTGQPDLEVSVVFRFSFPNEPVFKMQQLVHGWQRPVANFRQTEGEVFLTNRSRYSAKNPGVQVRLVSLGGLNPQWNTGWVPIGQANMVGVYEIQWDGGADFLVHGKWQRRLPPLNFADVFEMAETKPKTSAHGSRPGNARSGHFGTESVCPRRRL